MGEFEAVQQNAGNRNAALIGLKSIWNILLDAIFPPKCLVCRRLFAPALARSEIDYTTHADSQIRNLLPQAHRLLSAFCCGDCAKALMSVSEPLCTCCGMMFQQPRFENHLCGDCITRPKKFRMARAAVIYDQQSMAIIHQFKYAGKAQLAKPFGRFLLNTFLRYWQGEAIDLILPVPLHAKKLRFRGFNQSCLMVDSWKTICAPIPVAAPHQRLRTDVLHRCRATVPQTGLGRRQRLQNIKGAFNVRSPDTVKARKVLVVDDVYTTGATVNECARALLDAGAAQVDVLTLARAI